MNDELTKNEIRKSFLTVRRGEIYRAVIDHTEKLLIEEALKKCSGNQIAAARALGVNRNTLRSKIKRLKIDIGRYKFCHN